MQVAQAHTFRIATQAEDCDDVMLGETARPDTALLEQLQRFLLPEAAMAVAGMNDVDSWAPTQVVSHGACGLQFTAAEDLDDVMLGDSAKPGGDMQTQLLQVRQAEAAVLEPQPKASTSDADTLGPAGSQDLRSSALHDIMACVQPQPSRETAADEPNEDAASTEHTAVYEDDFDE